MAKILDGKKASAELLKKITKEVSAWKKRGVTPGIAFILVGHHPASQIYVRNKVAACAKVGIVSQKIELPASISEQKLCETIRKCNKNKNIHGILVQLPLPASIHAQRVLSSIDPKKDVDGFHPGNSGKLVLGIDGLRPCTPLGILYLLESLKMNWQGKNAVVIGRSAVVGKPVALMLLEQDMTVQICHSKTKNLKEKVLQADLLVVAAGKAKLVPGSWIKKGAVVIDVGIHRLSNGKIVGDVDFSSAQKRARAITPVPGGVGPMTIAMLLKNTLEALQEQMGVL